ncbi:MAG: hypothetical protein DMF00_10655 [Verrucomicrobia bacterium]|nr:MAG: hypothetical protein DMF00_10655 [Verrucomicrobiota bacterium]
MEILLTANRDECFADVTYSHTSIGPAGDEFVATFAADHYQKFMRDWERQLNHFLKSGRRPPNASNQSAPANQQKS